MTPARGLQENIQLLAMNVDHAIIYIERLGYTDDVETFLGAIHEEIVRLKDRTAELVDVLFFEQEDRMADH